MVPVRCSRVDGLCLQDKPASFESYIFFVAGVLPTEFMSQGTICLCE